MTQEIPDPAGNCSARRRLLRGTFAAPAVLTLLSGGALAATSATCVAKAQFNPQTGDVMEGTPSDTFMRVQLYETQNGTNPKEYWLARSSIDAFNGAASIIATSGRYTRFLIDENQLSVANSDVNKQLSGETLSSNPAKWVALRFNGTGTLVGVGDTGGGSAITGSCWTSTY